MKYFVDAVICTLLIILIHAIYSLGTILQETRPAGDDGAAQTAFYKCGKNKKTDVYCPIVIKGG